MNKKYFVSYWAWNEWMGTWCPGNLITDLFPLDWENQVNKDDVSNPKKKYTVVWWKELKEDHVE